MQNIKYIVLYYEDSITSLTTIHVLPFIVLTIIISVRAETISPSVDEQKINLQLF